MAEKYEKAENDQKDQSSETTSSIENIANLSHSSGAPRECFRHSPPKQTVLSISFNHKFS